jgi:hypothetical protein
VDKNVKEACGAAALVLLGLAVWLPFIYLLNGFVFMSLWNWFVVPFLGLPQLSIGYAIGLAMVVYFLVHHVSHTSEGKLSVSIGLATTRPLTALLFGYVLHLIIS